MLVAKISGVVCVLTFPSCLMVSLQVVAGMRYRVKIQVGDEHWHLAIIKPLPHTNEPAFVVEGSVQKGKSVEDPFE